MSGYFSPYIDETGFHYPSYEQIVDDIVSQFQQIYGGGIYLGSDSQDWQIISIFALKIYEAYQAAEMAYNAHSPSTAIGTGLDFIVALNGIRRAQGTKSTVSLTLTGAAGTLINNGIVSDVAGVLWDLPETVTIGAGGTVDVVAKCRNAGVTEAAVGTVTRIMTPTIGWISVTNPSTATVGTYVESDSSLRARQIASVAQASQTVLEGLKGAILSLPEVTRCETLENDTNATDANGLPPHSICCVVENGNNPDIAKTILLHKSCGCATYGSTTETVDDGAGTTYSIKFSRPISVEIDVQIELTRKAGYSEAYEDEIASAISQYVDTFTIGSPLVTSMLWMVVAGVNPDYRSPTFAITSVKTARHGETLSTDDLALDYNEVAHVNVNNIVIIAS